MVTRALLFAFLLLPLTAAAEHARPTFSVHGQVIAAALPVSILANADVRRQLMSGLTATFVVAARNRRTNAVTGARMEIRYDLWDEVWIARRIEFDRRHEPQRLSSFEALEKWWRTPCRLLASSDARVPLHIDLAVLPFSAAEREDARRWISKSGGVGTASSGSGLVDALIGTTLEAEPILSYRWTVELATR